MRTKKVNECAVTSERSVLVKIANSNFMPRCVDSVGIRILWLRSSELFNGIRYIGAYCMLSLLRSGKIDPISH